MKYARIINSTVVEIIEVPSGFSIEQCLVPDLAAQCVPCHDGVQQFWTFDGETFAEPNVISIEE